jgi:hypothetical protein
VNFIKPVARNMYLRVAPTVGSNCFYKLLYHCHREVLRVNDLSSVGRDHELGSC